MQDLKITIVQTTPYWEDINANLELFDAIIDEKADMASDLIVLPEMFTTGFTMNAEKFSQTMDESCVSWMKQKSRETNTDITGSIIIKEKKKLFNRLIWTKPSGELFCYDKKHLFRFSGEDKIFTPGSKKIIITLKGWNICPFICYDLRFPMWTRNLYKTTINSFTGKNSDTSKNLDIRQNRRSSEAAGLIPERPHGGYKLAYDIAVFVANWPETRSCHWSALLKARAIENQAYIIGVNRVGQDGNGLEYSGDSSIIDPKGKILFQKTSASCVHTEEISFKFLHAYRQNFPAWADSDEFIIPP